MRKGSKTVLHGKGPFSSINKFTTTIRMAEYWRLTGRSDVHDELMESLLKKEVADEGGEGNEEGKGRDKK
jgi:hypothetical protein